MPHTLDPVGPFLDPIPPFGDSMGPVGPLLPPVAQIRRHSCVSEWNICRFSAVLDGLCKCLPMCAHFLAFDSCIDCLGPFERYCVYLWCLAIFILACIGSEA